MRLFELFEAEEKHITFCFGRMNPPTIGHEQVFKTMSSVGGDYEIFVSQSQDKKDNPLDYSTKIKFIKLIHAKYAEHVVQDPNLNTVVKVASYLYDKGYKHATFVAGSDRLAQFQKLLSDYNGVEGKSHGFYKFETLDFKSSGDREDGAEGVAGVSASGARAAAANSDMEGFIKATGAGQYAEELYNAVRQGMGIKETATESTLRDKEDYQAKRKALDDLGRNKDIDQKAVLQRRLDLDKEAKRKNIKSEDAAGVGIITKQNTTADVGPGTIRKNLKAFNLVGKKKK
jgi:hypothetical protein